MKCIIGLGNPGSKYANTKHNLGFNVVAKVAEKLNVVAQKEKFKALFAKTVYKGESVILMQPLTFMNRSGLSVREVVNFYNLDLEDIMIIYDDKDFDIGQIRIRKKGSSGGHNGVQSVIDALGTNEFPRMRVGIGSPEFDQISYVLSKFDESEQKIIDKVIDIASEAAIYSINNTLDNTMNKYNSDLDK
ncbi:MAG: aminoacyl-tRNA hydrolase [Clostridia bacterium]